MEKCYINGMGCVSAQPTLQKDFWESVVDYSQENILPVLKPEYKEFIPPAAIRRMSNSVKNSVVAANTAMREADTENIGAIIAGTGLGCISDSEKFLNKLLDNDEQYLTPTSFIQSTHNTVAGQIALGLKCKSYNLTYVNGGASFPSALLDGMMKVGIGKKTTLVGGVDELSSYTNNLYQLIGHYRQEETFHNSVLEDRGEGCVPSEGSTFFILEKEQKSTTYAEIEDVWLLNNCKKEELLTFVKQSLARKKLEIEDIDLILLGNNGDAKFDVFYDELENIAGGIPVVYYKHLFGDFMASPSLSLWIAAKIFKEKEVPSVLFKKGNYKKVTTPQRILIYNQYRGKDHSLILLKNV